MATYTQLTEEIVGKILTKYDVGTLVKVSLMDGGMANSSCRVTTTTGKYVLCVCDEKNSAELQLLTNCLAYLNRKNFSTSRVVPVKGGAGYCMLDGKPVYLKEFIEGDVSSELSVEQVEQVGEGLASLHRIDAPDFIPRVYSLGVGAYGELIERGDDYARWLEGKRQLISPYLTDDLPSGLVHADLFWDNLLFNGATLAAILDFEEVCRTHLILDLGMTAVGCCSRDGQLDMDLTAALIRGYQRLRGLTDRERSSLRIFIIYAATSASLWRYRQFNIVRPDPEQKDHYLEMSSIADSLENMQESLFEKLY